jgi:glycosyltransferase involved in cell wall biosynthesis
MRILKLYDGDYPWDVRVEKILRSLVAAGHEVTLVARNRHGLPRRERLQDPPGVQMRRLPPGGSLTFPFFANPLWIRETRQAARASEPDRILVRDLPLAPLGLWLGRKLRCPVLVDMAEPYPLALRSNWQFDDLGGLDHLLRSPRLADAVERWVLRRNPRVLVVSEESGERLQALGLPRERWTLVGNTPDLARLPPVSKAAPPWAEAFPGRLILLFTGILVGDRGLDVAIHGLARLLEARGPVAALVVAGDGPARSGFEACAREAGVADAVRFLGWTPHEELAALWRAADVGILPFRDCAHIQTTLANKLFDFMATGLPVLACDVRPMRRVLSETGAGLTFPPGDAAGFAAAVGRLLDDPPSMRAMGERGHRAAQARYCWARDAERLLGALEGP